MEKVYLTENAKQILGSLKKGNIVEPKESDSNDIILLMQEEFITAQKTVGGFANLQLTDKATAYIHINPKLKNPSIWDDKKYIITTAIAIAAIVISIIALFKK